MAFRVRPGLVGMAMELFTQLFGDLLAFVYHCFDRIVIYGYLSGLSRPEQVLHFFRNVVGVAVVDKEVFSRRTADYRLSIRPIVHVKGIRSTMTDWHAAFMKLHDAWRLVPEQYRQGLREP